MFEQDITEDMIQGVLVNPQWTPSVSRRIRYDGVVEDGRRRCVVVSATDESRVVSAFWYLEELNQ
jgi:hypothetical protein